MESSSDRFPMGTKDDIFFREVIAKHERLHVEALEAVADAARAYLKDCHFAQWCDLNDALKELDKGK